MTRFRGLLSPAVVTLLALPLFALGCTETPAAPTTTAPFTHTDLRIGTGAEAATGQVLDVNYTGWLYDATRPEQKGLQFDTSTGRSPLTFTVGSGQVIKGWDSGLPGMKVGGRRRLIIPPSLGYGATRSGPIPPNATLVFDIDLLNVK